VPGEIPTDQFEAVLLAFPAMTAAAPVVALQLQAQWRDDTVTGKKDARGKRHGSVHGKDIALRNGRASCGRLIARHPRIENSI
jgi:hypothetical protein